MTVVQASLNDQGDIFEQSEALLMLYYGLKYVLTMSEAGFVDLFNFLEQKSQARPENYFQHRMALGGMSMCSYQTFRKSS